MTWSWASAWAAGPLWLPCGHPVVTYSTTPGMPDAFGTGCAAACTVVAPVTPGGMTSALASVTMSQIAAAAGIGRATLYKYFPDVEAILIAWHDRQITRHLRQLAEARDSAVTPAARLEAVLEAFAWIQHQHHHTELPVALLHRGEHIARARQQLQDQPRLYGDLFEGTPSGLRLAVVGQRCGSSGVEGHVR